MSYKSKGHLVLDRKEVLLSGRTEMYTDIVMEFGAPLDSCVSFIDCTKIKMTRASLAWQSTTKLSFGHERFHFLISQTVTTPDGLNFNLYGPEVGRLHDVTLLRQIKH